MSAESAVLVQLMTADIRSARRGGVLSPAALAEHLVGRGWKPFAAEQLAASTDELARAGGLPFDVATDAVADVIEGFALVPPEHEEPARYAAGHCTNQTPHESHDWRHWRSTSSYVWQWCDGVPSEHDTIREDTHHG